MMSGIRARNTQPELLLRRALHASGYRYRLHAPDLPGRPDLVFPKYRAVLQVHGCFWHRHGCAKTSTPATNADFWRAKFRQNVERDQKVEAKLRELGWRIGVVWECSIGRTVGSALLESVSNFLDDPSLQHFEWPTIA